MTRRRRLLRALNPIFRQLGSASTDLNRTNARQRTAKDDAVYEAYVFAHVVQSLYDQGWALMAVPAQTMYRFRRSPGKLQTTPTNASYVRCETPKGVYELHCDTYVAARQQGAQLEVDVLMLPESHAEDVRKGRESYPSYHHLLLILDAKYTADGVQTAEAKLVLAICQSLYPNAAHRGVVSDGDVGSNATNLLRNHEPPIMTYGNVYPIDGNRGEVAGFVSALGAALSQIAGGAQRICPRPRPRRTIGF